MTGQLLSPPKMHTQDGEQFPGFNLRYIVYRFGCGVVDHCSKLASRSRMSPRIIVGMDLWDNPDHLLDKEKSRLLREASIHLSPNGVRDDRRTLFIHRSSELDRVIGSSSHFSKFLFIPSYGLDRANLAFKTRASDLRTVGRCAVLCGVAKKGALGPLSPRVLDSLLRLGIGGLDMQHRFRELELELKLGLLSKSIARTISLSSSQHQMKSLGGRVVLTWQQLPHFVKKFRATAASYMNLDLYCSKHYRMYQVDAILRESMVWKCPK
ncbi:hypothetical protein Tco_0104607 [Tanacetum coccineum]